MMFMLQGKDGDLLVMRDPNVKEFLSQVFPSDLHPWVMLLATPEGVYG